MVELYDYRCIKRNDEYKKSPVRDRASDFRRGFFQLSETNQCHPVWLKVLVDNFGIKP